jgi:hypothetical protein
LRGVARPPLPAAVFFCAVVRARDPLLRDAEPLLRDAGALLRDPGLVVLRAAVLLLREVEPVERALGLLLRDDAGLVLADEDAEPVRLRLEVPREAVLFAVRVFEVPVVFLVVLFLSAM